MSTSFTMETEQYNSSVTSGKSESSMVFSIKDLKSDNFGSLFVCNTCDEAIRVTKVRLMYDQGSLIQQFPADFMLYHVGYFNTKTGIMDSVGIALPIKSILDVSLELEHERQAKVVDIPDFLNKSDNEKGADNVIGIKESNTCECS